MLLEKAWAKLHGTYIRSEAGYPYFAASHLLGVPSEVYCHKDFETEAKKQKFFKEVQDYDRKDYMIMGSSQGKNESVAENGIV
jgi:hypothetical protein